MIFPGGAVKKLGANFVAAEDKLIRPAAGRPSQWTPATSTTTTSQASSLVT